MGTDRAAQRARPAGSRLFSLLLVILTCGAGCVGNPTGPQPEARIGDRSPSPVAAPPSPASGSPAAPSPSPARPAAPSPAAAARPAGSPGAAAPSPSPVAKTSPAPAGKTASPGPTGSPGPVVRVPSPAASPSAIPQADWGTVTIKRGDPIRIVFAAPLSGENAGLGVDEQRGAELAIEETPQVKGFPIRLVPEDDGCAADRATTVAQKVVADPQVVGVVGHLCSSASLPASTVYEPAHVVMISPSSTAPALTARGLAVVNRVIWNDEVQAIEAARFARNTLRAGTVAALHDGSLFGLALAGSFREETGRLGGRVGGFEGFTPGEQDYRPVLTRLAAARPEVIYFAGSVREAALVAAQLPDVGLRGVRLIGSDLIYSPAYLQQAGSAPTETYATYAEAATQSSPRRNDFDRRYEAKYRARPRDAGAFHYHAYDAAALLIQKIDQVATVNAAGDLTIGRNALARAVRTTASFPGLTGSITCQSTGDCGTSRVVINVARNGRWEPATP